MFLLTKVHRRQLIPTEDIIFDYSRRKSNVTVTATATHLQVWHFTERVIAHRTKEMFVNQYTDEAVDKHSIILN